MPRDPSPGEIRPIAEKHGIPLVLRSGSSLTGKTHARSDVGLAASLARAAETLQADAELLEDLQTLFPNREVDLAIPNRADRLILRKIAEAYQFLYGSRRGLERLRTYAFQRCQDHRRYCDMERRYVERSLAENATPS